MAWTQGDIDKLKKAIAKGARSVSYASGSVTYNSLDDMMKTLRIMEAEVSPQSAAPSRFVARFTRGF